MELPPLSAYEDDARAIGEKVVGLRGQARPLIGEPPPVALIPGTDMANARRMHRRHGANLHYTVERGWLVWSGRHWQIDDKAVAVAQLAKESAESMLDEIRTAPDQKQAFKDAKAAAQKRAIEASIWLARSEPGIYQQLVTFDADPMILNVGNGIIDLTTGELNPHEQDARCTMLAGCDYDAHAVAPRWRQFVSEVCLENVELMDYIQRMCGYLLTATVQEHCLFFLHGGGRNGKSVLVETIMKVMGDYACAAEPEMLMTRKHAGIPNDVARLRGRRAVFLNETNQGHRFDEAKLKNLTGGDKLNARFLREEFFDFAPTHKLCLRGNHKPTVNGTDEGIWSRLRLIPFNLRLAPADVDQSLPNALARELPGILAWCVQGCLQWQQHGLATPQVILDAMADYRTESDTLGRFIDEGCTLGPRLKVSTNALFGRYREYCEAACERYLSAKDFPSEMERRGFQRVKSHGLKYFQGVELKHIPFEEERSWHND